MFSPHGPRRLPRRSDSRTRPIARNGKRDARIRVGGVVLHRRIDGGVQDAGPAVDRAAVERICEQRIREKAAAYAHIDDQVMTLIADVARRGVGLGVISNGFKEDVLPWSHCSLAPAFQCTGFSCEEGLAKPDPEIYRRVMRRLGAQPETTVYVGDGADNELAGAERAGFRACRAVWFVRETPRQGVWPELTGCDDVLNLVAAG